MEETFHIFEKSATGLLSEIRHFLPKHFLSPKCYALFISGL